MLMCRSTAAKGSALQWQRQCCSADLSIATRYSGNMDFMDDSNSLLVDCHVVRLDGISKPYKAGLRWAEHPLRMRPQHMRRLYDDPNSLATSAQGPKRISNCGSPIERPAKPWATSL